MIPWIRQSVTDDPCGAGPTRSRARRASAYADGSRELAPGAGCSAGRSACPWPRLYLLVVWRPLSGAHACACTPAFATAVGKLWSRSNRRGPESVAAVSPTYGRLFEVLTSLPLVKPPCRAVDHRTDPPLLPQPSPFPQLRYLVVIRMLQNGWHPPPRKKLLASAKAVSDRGGAQSPSGGGTGRRTVHTRSMRGDYCRPATLRRYAPRRTDCPVHTCG